LIIDLILTKHNMTKDWYQSKIIVDLGMNYERLMYVTIIAYCFGRSTMMTPNVCIVVGPYT
jgi:hypothetical protein